MMDRNDKTIKRLGFTLDEKTGQILIELERQYLRQVKTRIYTAKIIDALEYLISDALGRTRGKHEEYAYAEMLCTFLVDRQPKNEVPFEYAFNEGKNLITGY